MCLPAAWREAKTQQACCLAPVTMAWCRQRGCHCSSACVICLRGRLCASANWSCMLALLPLPWLQASRCRQGVPGSSQGQVCCRVCRLQQQQHGEQGLLPVTGARKGPAYEQPGRPEPSWLSSSTAAHHLLPHSMPLRS